MRRVLLSILFYPVTLYATAKYTGGVKSYYTSKLPSIIAQTLAKPPAGTHPSDLALTCIKHPHDSFYIGLKQSMTIDAPMSRVKNVLDNINEYSHLFPGYKNVHIINEHNGRIYTLWEQRAPVIFLPDIKYEIIYQIQKLKRGWLYKYQLRKPTTITASDGFILLRRLGKGKISYVEFDFFNANWGPARLLGANKIWFDSVMGLAQSDLATKLRAENEFWSNDRARIAARKLIHTQSIQYCIHHKILLKNLD